MKRRLASNRDLIDNELASHILYLASVPFLILCVAKESEHKDKKEEPAQRHPVERILKLGSQVCLAVSSFIGVGVVAQLLIKEGITSQATLFLDFLFKKEGSGDRRLVSFVVMSAMSPFKWLLVRSVKGLAVFLIQEKKEE